MDPDLSVEPSVIRRLTEAQKERLSGLLDSYLIQLEEGLVPDAEKMVAENEDLAEALNSYLQHLKVLHDVAAGFATAEEESDEEDDGGSEQRLGDFSLLREIGRGGMGVVYEARQLSLDRRVAIKVLPFASVLDKKQISRFKNEAQAAAQVQHPNIVPVYAVGADRGVHYYAMRFVDGLPLDRVISRLDGAGVEPEPTLEGPRETNVARTVELDATVAWSVDTAADGTALDAPSSSGTGADSSPQSSPAAATPVVATPLVNRPVQKSGDSFVVAGTSEVVESSTASYLEQPRKFSREYFQEVARLGVQAAQAINAAHEYGIVHRDIKPSNLMIDESGKLWVTDFGLARFQTDASLTKTGDLLGTLRYMSPEQATGNNAFVDHRTDIYSLAATLYELMTLQAAFPGENNPGLLREIEAVEPVRPRQLQREVPSDLETVVLKAMSKSRDERYDTAADFADDLQRVVDGLPTVAQPPTWLDRTVQWTRRHQRVVLLTTAACATLSIVLGVSFLSIQDAKHASDRHLSDATRHLERSREAVEDLGLQMAEELQHLPGAAHLQKEVLMRSLAYYREIARDRSNDPTLQADIALAHSKIGTIYHRLGEYEQAVEAYRNSLSMFTKLQVEDPQNVELHRSIGICQNNLGQVIAEQGDTSSALQAFEESLAWLRPLAQREDAIQPNADLARTENNLAMLLVGLNRKSEAEEKFRAAIHRLQPCVERQAEDVELVTQLGRSCYNLSTLLKATGNDEAARYNRIAMRAYQNLPDSAVETPQHVTALALIFNHQGSIHLASEEFAQAIELHQAAAKSLRDLMRLAPNDMRLKKDLALTLNSLGRAFSEAKQTVDAKRELAAAVTLQQELVELTPDDPELQHTLGGIFNNLGIALEQDEKYEEASGAFRVAVEAQRQAVNRVPRATKYRRFLSQHLVNLGRLMRRLGDPDAAADVAYQRIDLFQGTQESLLPIAEELTMAADMMDSNPEKREKLYEVALSLVKQAMEAGRLQSIDRLPETMDSLKQIYKLKGWPKL